MYDPQHFVDLQENPKSWLTADANSSLSHRSHLAGGGGSLNRDLFKDLVEIVPLVESLIDRKPNSSFTRRGSIVYTKMPSRESLSKKMIDAKGRNVTQSISAKKKRDNGDKEQSKSTNISQDGDAFSLFSSRALATEKDMEELVALREQVEDLQKKLLEKDELLKSAETSISQINAVHVKFDELKRQAAEKDSLIKSTQLQLSDAKVKLADKQAALEKLQWQAMTSNQKAEKLQEDLESIQGDISSFMLLFEGLTKNASPIDAKDYDIKPCYLDHLPDIDDLDDIEMQRMEEAREAYIAAVVAAKQRQDEESIAAAFRARRRLQSFAFRSHSMNSSKDFSNGGVS